MDKKDKSPNKSSGDYIHSIVNASLGAVPIAGTFLSELFLNVIMPPYEKRKEEWMINVANRIEELDLQIAGFKIDDLKENEVFLDAVLVATKAAIATSSREKQDGLLNALQNIALQKNQDEVKNLIFLNFIEQFTDAHIAICSILEMPNNFRDLRGEFDTKETCRELIKKKLSNIDDQVINVIVKDLYDNGLITISIPGLDNAPSFMQEDRSHLTEFGKQFLIFITKPSL